MLRAVFVFLCCLSSLQALNFKTGRKKSNNRYIPKVSFEKHLEFAEKALEAQNIKEAKYHLKVIVYQGETSTVYSKAEYLLANLFFSLNNYEDANRYFSSYLNHTQDGEGVDQVFEKKYKIAMAYTTKTTKRHLLGSKSLPKLSSGKKVALELFDEVIVSLPGTDFAASSYFEKAGILLRTKQHTQALEEYEKLVIYYPYHEYVAEAHLKIGEIYLQKIGKGNYNMEYMHTAITNREKFIKLFPIDERIQVLDQMIESMKEKLAQVLFDRAKFYKRMKKPHSSKIYYQKILMEFPDTKVAKEAKIKLYKLSNKT